MLVPCLDPTKVGRGRPRPIEAYDRIGSRGRYWTPVGTPVYLEAADSVAARLVDIASTAQDDRVAIGACCDVLDRAGVSPPKPVEVIPGTWSKEIARLEAELGITDDVTNG